jgi:integration host factor subunit beta
VSDDKLTKANIVDAVWEKTGIDRQDVKTVLDLVLSEIKGALYADKTIELRKFGTFLVRKRKGRQKARNPRTGENVSYASHGIASFKPGKDMRAGVWGLRRAEASQEETGPEPPPETDA